MHDVNVLLRGSANFCTTIRVVPRVEASRPLVGLRAFFVCFRIVLDNFANNCLMRKMSTCLCKIKEEF